MPLRHNIRTSIAKCCGKIANMNPSTTPRTTANVSLPPSLSRHFSQKDSFKLRLHCRHRCGRQVYELESMHAAAIANSSDSLHPLTGPPLSWIFTIISNLQPHIHAPCYCATGDFIQEIRHAVAGQYTYPYISRIPMDSQTYVTDRLARATMDHLIHITRLEAILIECHCYCVIFMDEMRNGGVEATTPPP